jgi:hypothetical protein
MRKVEQDAPGLVGERRAEKLVAGAERLGPIAERADQAPGGRLHRGIVIDDGDERRLTGAWWLMALIGTRHEATVPRVGETL